MNYIDSLLDRITTYRLLFYYLIALVAAAMLLGSLGLLSYSPISIFLMTSYTVFVCWIINLCFAAYFQVPHNPESSLITGLILSLLISPIFKMDTLIFLTAASGLAIASKYLITFRSTHLFNPVAIAIVLTSLGAGDSANWWVGSVQLVPFVILGGLLLIRRTQKIQMVLIYFSVALLSTLFIASFKGIDLLTTLQATIFHSSLFFLGFVMLTEPFSSPASAKNQRWYALFTGLLFSPQISLFGLYSTPELSLVLGNLFSFIVSPKFRFSPHFKERIAWGDRVSDFIFTTDRHLSYLPGQYIELTLPHARQDARGSRRYFTLASSPTENELHIGVKFYPDGSTFKNTLQTITPETPLLMGQLAGEFTLPRSSTKKLTFIAAGIGITPFRSMMKYLIDTDKQQPVTLFYIERDDQNLAYTDVFEHAKKQLGSTIYYILTGQTEQLPLNTVGHSITPSLIKEKLPDYKEQLFYISGPRAVVTSTKQMLIGLGVSRRHIKTDFFPGL